MTADTRGCYVYGIVTAEATAPEGLTGLDGASVELVEYDGLAAVVSTIDVNRPLGSRDDLMAHSQAVDAFAAEGAVVPVRFGSVLPARSDVVAEFLEPNSEQFLELLGSLAGSAQFTLRARYDEAVVMAEVLAEHPGIVELRDQLRDLPEEAAYGERIHLGELVADALATKREVDGGVILDAVAPHVLAYNLHDGEGIDHLMDVALLVHNEQREAFERVAESIAAEMHHRAKLKLFGPSAPYDFVTQE